jgi:acetyl coenzyme A synthetase (ADP forming)-like protein
VLRDGSTAHVRRVRTADEGALVTFLEGLSSESMRLRFFGAGLSPRAMAAQMIAFAGEGGAGLIATTGAGDRIIAHAMLALTGAGRAEVAFAVAEDHYALGLATVLLGQLAEIAPAYGVSVFEATVLPENHRMIGVFRESGFAVTTRLTTGEIEVEFPVALDEPALRRFEEREHEAGVAAMRRLLYPRSVAVIGASRHRGGIAAEVFHNLVATGFGGPVYPVNRSSRVVQSVTAYGSVLDIPDEVDLAVVVVPAAAVLDVVRECGEKGVRSLVVISSGFGETGPKGARMQQKLVDEVRRHGMRLVGPNCMGIMNTDPEVLLNATFAPHFPAAGSVAFMSQSGGLGLAIIEVAARLGLGLSYFMAVGNKADFSGNDLLEFCEEDPATKLVLLYLESFGNPRKFGRLARRVSMKKPIVAVKAGRTSAGARAAGSHTGALLAASDITVDALFRHSGVVRTETLAEMFGVAALLSNQPIPHGDRVVVVTNAGGPGILCADACEATGLRVVELSDKLRSLLRRLLPPNAAVSNPIDMTAAASAEHYATAIEALARSGVADSIVVIFVPPLVIDPTDVARALREVAQKLGDAVTLCSVFMSAEGLPAELGARSRRIPSFAFPEEAALALSRAVTYGAWRAAPKGQVPTLSGIDQDLASARLARELAEPGWLALDRAAAVLAAYGIPLAPWRLVGSPAEAGRAARELHGPLALKAVSSRLLHKSDVGGVRLHLDGPRAAASEARRMTRALGRDGDLGFLVQEMAPAGVELLVGMVHDPLFGPVLACGAGGTTAELLGDVQVRVTPVSDLDVREMVSSLRTYRLLQGYRGSPAADLAAVEDVLLRVGAMVENHPEIAELDLNPLIAGPDGALVVDWRMRLAPPAPSRPLGSR